MGKVTVIVSGRGGAGKTMFAVNLASCLAMQGGRVLLIDMNSGCRNLDLCLGLESQVVYDLGDIVNGICTIKKALVRDGRFQSLYLLSASQNSEKALIRPAHMKKLCEKLKVKFDHIIIDTPYSIAPEWASAVSSADLAVLLTTQEYVSLRDSDSLHRRLLDIGVPRIFVLINRVRAEYEHNSSFPSISKIAAELRMPVAGIIQEDENIHVAMNSGIPVVCKKDSYISKNFVKIAGRMFADMETTCAAPGAEQD